MRLFFLCTLSMVSAVAASTAQCAEVYRWVDGRGGVYYSDAEPIDVDADRVVIDEESEQGTMMISATTEEVVPRPVPEQPPLIVALTTDDLGPCALARQQLTLLHADVEVFLAEDGLWRGGPGSTDAPRSWLADASRPNAIRVARSRVLQNCSNPQSVADELNTQKSAQN